ncbi:hypothetical protein [Streptomyces sp. NPDC047869]|uniref:hypothetical protein n=1 Tax=Streptomyces sp. NPDC047869 TaxID=3154709 RepID=UPI0034517826
MVGLPLVRAEGPGVRRAPPDDGDEGDGSALVDGMVDRVGRTAVGDGERGRPWKGA